MKADLTADEKKRFKADIDAMNVILLGIPNVIYNTVDACKIAQAMWACVKCLMQGNELSRQDMMSRLNEEIMNESKAKRASRTHDPVALVVNSYTTPSSSHVSQPYYVTHPPSKNDSKVDTQSYDFQAELISDDPLENLNATMMTLARVIDQQYSTPTNNRLRVFLNTRNQAYVQGGRIDVQCKNTRNVRVIRLRIVQNQKLEIRTTSKSVCYLAKKDEAVIPLTHEENEFLVADLSNDEELDDLSYSCNRMARIQEVHTNSVTAPSYDFDVSNKVSD
nr:hypothetical protein [Tanacetum cinerariifolium]